MTLRQRSFLVALALAALPACTPVRQTARDEPPQRTGDVGVELDAGAFSDAPASVDARADAPAGDGATDAEGPDPPAPGPQGPVIASAELGDAGAALRVEAIDGGFGFRLVAPEGEPLAVEPAGLLEGPTKAGLLFGAGCLRAPAGGAVLLGEWSGELARCVTSPALQAVLRLRPPRPGCPLEPAAPGRWTLSLFACGRYSEPLAQVGFEVPSAEAPGGEEAGPAAEPGDGGVQ